MPRARNIKPGFFKNEDLAECSMAARLCFAGLWTLADREGRLEDRPKRIKAELFAFDSVDIERLLRELEAQRFIVRYETDGLEAIQILKFTEHQSPHYSEKASVIKPPILPESKAIIPASIPGKGDSSRGGRNPLNPESRILNPDSRLLNPDSGIHDVPTGLFAEGSAPPPPAKKPRAPRKPKDPSTAVESPTAGTWKAYSQAYGVRYAVDPVRNATVNGQLANLVARLGAEEAPSVAAHYVRSSNARYVAAGHSVGMLVMDAEKLRTEWATGRQGTQTQAQQADRTQTNLNAFAGMLAEASEKETRGIN